MTILSWRAGLAAAVLAFAGYAVAQPATPQQQEAARQQAERNVTQPYNNAPYWHEVRTSDPGFTQVGDSPERGVLIQSRGETWRQARVPVALDRWAARRPGDGVTRRLLCLSRLDTGRRERFEDDGPALSSGG